MSAPPQSSRVPAAVDALVALANAMKAAGDVDEVLDGPTAKGATKNKTILAVFVSDSAATVRQTLMRGSVDTYEEVADIVCNIISWTGKPDTRPHREVCMTILEKFRERIEADHSLGGICSRATLGPAQRWSPVSDAEGGSVALAFSVAVTSYV